MRGPSGESIRNRASGQSSSPRVFLLLLATTQALSLGLHACGTEAGACRAPGRRSGPLLPGVHVLMVGPLVPSLWLP